MTGRYNKSVEYNGDKIEVFEAEEVIDTFKDFVNTYKLEHEQKLELEKELTFFKKLIEFTEKN